MPRMHGANKSILFAQTFDPYKVTPLEFAQIKGYLFAQGWGNWSAGGSNLLSLLHRESSMWFFTSAALCAKTFANGIGW